MSDTQTYQCGPLLAGINSPADLRRLSVDQLPQLCEEIRQFLIHALADNPGHFASSMGAVELTVALHYVFDTPYDRLVWDVGHQAYGHKLLTGRRERFDTNRKLGGICPFPNPDESEYDTFAAGHASNAISAALGMAVAARLTPEEKRRNVVAITGDASISGGLSFEGLNNASNTPNNLLIVLNDNDMSIDRNVGALNGYLANLTTSRRYNDLRYKAFKFLKNHGVINDHNKGLLLRFNNSLKALLTRSHNIFEGLNIRYFGPFDGHNVAELVRIFTDIRDMEGPRIVHLSTVKGKGYEPAELDPATWHAPGKFDAESGERIQSAALRPKYQDIFGDALLELAGKNEKIVGITAAMPSGTSMGTMMAALPERVFDVGISEGHAVTFAGGLAKDGMRPYVAIYSSFLQRAYDHIIHDVALHRLPVTFCIDRAGLVGEDGATHHGAFDLAYLRSIPGMIVASPRDPATLRNLLYTSQADNYGPFAIRYPRGNAAEPFTGSEFQTMEIGRGQQLAEGSAVAVLTIGPIADQAAKAIAQAKAEGIDAAHFDMIFAKPIDTDILRKVADMNCPIITVEDASVNGGMGSAVVEWLAENNIQRTVVRLGIPDNFITHGTPDQLRRLCGFDTEAILEAIKNATK